MNPATEGFVSNNDVEIHYLQFGTTDSTYLNRPPLIIIPGAVNAAEEVAASLNGALQYPHIIISIRGRGKSSSPAEGYTLDQQASDVNAVIKELGLHSFYLFGHSVGASIAIRAAVQNLKGLAGFILGDFAPFYPPLSPEWAEEVLTMDGVQITPVAARGLAKDAEYTDLLDDLNTLECPVLLVHAHWEQSAVRPEDVEALTKMCPTCTAVMLEDSNHELMSSNPVGFAQIIEQYINQWNEIKVSKAETIS